MEGQEQVVTKWLNLWPNKHVNPCSRGFSTQVWHQYSDFFIWLKLSASPNLMSIFKKELSFSENLKRLNLLQFTFYCTIPLLWIHSSFPLILKLSILSLSGCTLVDASQHHKQTNISHPQCSFTFLFVVSGCQSTT